MGITSSYVAFMEGNAIEQTFSAHEADDVDDTVQFRRTLGQDTTNGLVTFNVNEESMVVTKTAAFQARQATPPESDTPSLSESDRASAAVQKTPNRVTLESMVARIKHKSFLYPQTIPHMTICVLVLENGFSLVGKSAPADADNFDEELGRRFSYEDALRQMWPLEAYLLREYMFQAENTRVVSTYNPVTGDTTTYTAYSAAD